MTDMSSQSAILSLSLLRCKGRVGTELSPKVQMTSDSRFGNTTFQRFDFQLPPLEGGNIPRAPSSVYVLPASSEVEISRGIDEGAGSGDYDDGDISVAASVTCVLQHASTRRDTKDKWFADYDFLGGTLGHAAESLIGAVYGRDAVTAPPVSVNIMLGRGAVGAAWWDCTRRMAGRPTAAREVAYK